MLDVRNIPDDRMTAAVEADHREIEKVLRRLEDGVHDLGERRELVDRLIIDLVRHAVAEEQMIYPAVRRALPDGEAAAGQALAEHAEAERTMSELDGLDPVHPSFEPLVRRLVTVTRRHIAEEEGNLLPRLRYALGPADADALGDRFTTAKGTAPTHPHPGSSHGSVAGPLTALVDRVRDAVTGRGRSTPSE